MRSVLKLRDKKGAFELDQLQSVVITLVVIGITLGLGLIVMGEFYQESCKDDSWNSTTEKCDTDGHASDSINETKAAIGSMPGWLSLIVLVVVIGIILAIVFRVLPGAGTGAGAGASMGGY